MAEQEPGKLILISEIADAVDVPQSFLAKIFQDFTRLGIVRSSRGAKGGFCLARLSALITLREVVEAVEGPICPNRCLISAGACERSGTCNVHPVWRKIQNEVKQILDDVTLADLAKP